jgi:DNA-binding response OmpR family regulator
VSSARPCAAHRVLLIDDDAAVRDSLRDILEEDGYRVLPSPHVLDPDDVQQLRPDVMLLDLVLEGQAVGWDYLRTLRSRSSTARLPVIVCTGDYDTARVVTAPQLSLATAMILKPFELEELLGTVAAVIQADPIGGGPKFS